MNHKSTAWFVLSSVLAFACSPSASPEPKESSSQQPSDWQKELALPVPVDGNPDPHILEVDIEAKLQQLEILPGVLTEMWTYNGTVPGPLLRAQVGDRLVVHFTNHLAEATTVHWHGVRVPAAMDGSEAVQSAVQPGESFTYDFVLLDAGTFWYHPHVNSGAQVGYGLYGPIVVDDPNDPIDADDVVLLLSDVSLDDAGQLIAEDPEDWFGDFFGLEGNVLLVNGRVEPTLGIRPQLPQRWRVINATRSRFYAFTVPEAKVERVAGDAGLSEHAVPLEQLVLHPSERAELIVTVNATDALGLTVPSQDVDRFYVDNPEDDVPLFHLTPDSPSLVTPAPLPAQLRHFDDIDLSNLPIRPIILSETGDGELAINGEPYHGSHHETPHVGYVGDTEIWEVENATTWAHPFHLHGFSFQILDVGGETWPVREWKDTANIPPGQTLRFVTSYDDRPGMWMFHCHILGHAKLGMMSMLDIRPAL